MTAFLFTLAFCLLGFFQSEGARAIIPEEFVKARPVKSKTAPAKRPTYRNTSDNRTIKPSNPPDQFAQLGLTIWRLRPAASREIGARIIVHEEGQGTTIEWMPERIEANTPLRIGEHIRFSFESPQTGYLYVIDREQYANGTMGDPYLIFPTKRTRNGDNQVTAGRIIEIPSQDDRPNFFTLRQSRFDQVSENITVIVSKEPLKDVVISDKALKLSAAQVEQWEKEWGAQSEQFELVGGKGKTWTKEEQAAGADTTRSLTQNDPGPQTIYRVATKPGQPVLIKVGLKYSLPQPRAKRSR